jgi:hypothetical protein
MDFKSSPLGVLYGSLRDAVPSKAKVGRDLDPCELRADSKKESDLRIKTEKRSGWSSKARMAHQTNANHVVRDCFHRSVDRLIALRTGLTAPQKSQIRTEASTVLQTVTEAEDYCPKLSTLKTLFDRAVAVVGRDVPVQSPPSLSSASSASSSTSAGIQDTHLSSPARGFGEDVPVVFHPSPQAPTHHQFLGPPIPPTTQPPPPPKPAARDTKSKASAPSSAGVSIGDLPEQARPCFQKLAQDYQVQKAGSKTEAQIAHHVQRLKELVAFAYEAWPEGFKASSAAIPRAVQAAANLLDVDPKLAPEKACFRELPHAVANQVFKRLSPEDQSRVL